MGPLQGEKQEATMFVQLVETVITIGDLPGRTGNFERAGGEMKGGHGKFLRRSRKAQLESTRSESCNLQTNRVPLFRAAILLAKSVQIRGKCKRA
jgi:hypothetical protein